MLIPLAILSVYTLEHTLRRSDTLKFKTERKTQPSFVAVTDIITKKLISRPTRVDRTCMFTTHTARVILFSVVSVSVCFDVCQHDNS